MVATNPRHRARQESSQSQSPLSVVVAAVGLGFLDRGDEMEEMNGGNSIQLAARASNAEGRGIMDHMDLGYVYRWATGHGKRRNWHFSDVWFF